MLASSSRKSPALLASAALMSEQMISPATPAHSAQNMYTATLMKVARMPMYLLALGLAPMASMKMPSAVLRVRK